MDNYRWTLRIATISDTNNNYNAPGKINPYFKENPTAQEIADAVAALNALGRFTATNNYYRTETLSGAYSYSSAEEYGI